jgi:hypothetical protein
MLMRHVYVACVLIAVGGGVLAAAEPLPPMLRLPDVGEDPTQIDFAKLPAVRGEHAVVTVYDDAWKFRLHNYLAFHDGKYWCMWSHGPEVEDKPTQHVRYATSPDGLAWSEPRQIMGPSAKAKFRYIARGFWLRDGELLALASHDEAGGFFGPSLQLMAWRWTRDSETWQPLGAIYDDAINNFPPQKLPNGQWGMMRRDYKKNVSMMTGGVDSPSSWQATSVAPARAPDGFKPEEPDWWTLPDDRLLGLFRDNGKSHRFYRAVSVDNGLSWSVPEKTNFPDATSKFFCLRTSRGFYVLVSSANPEKRNPLCLSTSADGVTFTRMAALPIPEPLPGVTFDEKSSRYGSTKYDSYQYPHVIEHDGRLLIAFSRRKQTIEVVRVSLDDVTRLTE